MGEIANGFDEAFRDFNVDGVAGSGRAEVDKAKARELGGIIEVGLNGALAGITQVSDTAARDAFYAVEDNRKKLVYVNNNNGSATDPANGLYEYVGGPRLAQGFYAGITAVVQPLVDQAVAAAASATTATVPFRNTLADWVAQTPYLTETGYYYNSSGVRTANTSFQYSIYNVPADHQGIRATGRPNTQALVIYKNAVNGPSGAGSTLGYQFLNSTSNVMVDQDLTLPTGTLSIVVNSYTFVAPSLSAKVVAPTTAPNASSAAKASLKNSTALTTISVWQSAGTALTVATGEYYSASGVATVLAGYNRGLYVLTGQENGFRVSSGVNPTDSVAQIAYFYNADGTGLIGTEPATKGVLTGFAMTIPNGTKAIGFTTRTAYALSLELLMPPVLSNIGATWWKGKTAGLLGDSITAQNTWPSLFTTALGITATNFGISGTKISGAHDDANAMCGETRINAMPTTLDLITIMGGTNDWAQDTPLGDINGSVYLATVDASGVMTVTSFTSGPAIKVGDTVSGKGITPGTKITSFGTGTGATGTYNLSVNPGALTPARRMNGFDPTTFYGALNTFADRAYYRWPLKRIVLVTTPYGEKGVSPGWSSEAYNALGLSTNDYAEAIRQVARRRNFPVFDVARDAGWGTTNIADALNNGTDKLHPLAGSRAAAGIAAVYRNGARNIEPVS